MRYAIALAIALSGCGPKQTDLDAAQSDISALEAKVQSLEGQISDADSRADEADEIARAAVEAVNIQSARIAATEDALQEAQQRIDDLESRLGLVEVNQQ